MKEKYELTSPNMILAFISATFGLMNFSAACLSLANDSLIAIGIIRMLLGVVLFICAWINLLRGNIDGNINLIYAVCFGLFSGGNMILTVISRALHMEFAPVIYGLLQIFTGAFIGCFLPALRNVPFYSWLKYLCSVLGLLFFGFGDFFRNSNITYYGGWCFLLFTLLSLYGGLSAILPGLPQGKSLKQIVRAHKNL
jgi:hypothetical protein